MTNQTTEKKPINNNPTAPAKDPFKSACAVAMKFLCKPWNDSWSWNDCVLLVSEELGLKLSKDQIWAIGKCLQYRFAKIGKFNLGEEGLEDEYIVKLIQLEQNYAHKIQDKVERYKTRLKLQS